jgi:hypothetical protein
MTWEQKIASDESVAASAPEDIQTHRTAILNAWQLLQRSSEWIGVVCAAKISHAVGTGMDVILADAYLRGATAAKRVAEIEALEALTEK